MLTKPNVSSFGIYVIDETNIKVCLFRVNSSGQALQDMSVTNRRNTGNFAKASLCTPNLIHFASGKNTTFPTSFFEETTASIPL